jgi:hypothetical protein
MSIQLDGFWKQNATLLAVFATTCLVASWSHRKRPQLVENLQTNLKALFEAYVKNVEQLKETWDASSNHIETRLLCLNQLYELKGGVMFIQHLLNQQKDFQEEDIGTRISDLNAEWSHLAALWDSMIKKEFGQARGYSARSL